MNVSQARFGAARLRLAEVTRGLLQAASGEVVQRAAAKIQRVIDTVSTKKIEEHTRTGFARSIRRVDRSGGLITLDFPAYVAMSHNRAWFPFYNGMPPFVMRMAAKVFQAELVAALEGKPSPLAEAEATEALKAEKRAARKARAEALAAKREARLAREATKPKNDRAIDKRIREREEAADRGGRR